jgi:cytochrome c-type biogenesis protein CcmH
VRPLAAAVVVALALAVAPAHAAEPQASLPDIEDEVMCTICGSILALVPQAPQAEQQRDLIRGLIAEHKTKEEIKAVLVAEYGPEVLAMPDDEGFDLAAWIVPLAGIAIAIGAIGVAVSRWRRAAPAPAPPAAGIDPGDERRLAEDMRRY